MSERLQPRIVDAGLPGRTPLLLAREERLFPGSVQRLLTATRGAPPSAGPTLEQLLSALGSGDPVKVPRAAFVAGRVQADTAARTTINEVLGSFLEVGDPLDLGAGTWPYVESAMALALQGETERAHGALAPLAGRDVLASAYLAQLGDCSGWPGVRDQLAATDGFSRLTAARYLAAFASYEGRTCGGAPVALRTALEDRLDDEDPVVGKEVPGLLAELYGRDVIDLLRHTASSAKHQDVREAAEDVLDQLETS